LIIRIFVGYKDSKIRAFFKSKVQQITIKEARKRLICLANQTGIDLTDALLKNLE